MEKNFSKTRSRSNALNVVNLYLKYIMVTGTFPMVNVRIGKKVRFQWLSWNVAYTLGILLFVAVYGFVRIIRVLTTERGFKIFSTDDLVMMSVTLTTPTVAFVSIVGMLCKAPLISRFLRLWSHIPSSKPRWINCLILLLSMTICLALGLLGKGPKVFNPRGNNSSRTSQLLADTLFWIFVAPSITSPSILYSYVVRELGYQFQDLKKNCDNFLAQEKRSKFSTAGHCTKETARVRYFRKRYSHLASVVQMANEAFSPVLLITLLYYAIELCMYLYELVVILIFQTEERVFKNAQFLVIFCALFFYFLLTTIEGAQLLQDQGEKCLETFSKSANSVHDTECIPFITFMMGSYARPPQCNASSYLTINRAFFVAAMSAILTFITILVQFKESEKD